MIKVTKEKFLDPCAGCNKGQSHCCTYINVDIPEFEVDGELTDEIDLDQVYWWLTRDVFTIAMVYDDDGNPTTDIDSWDATIEQKCNFLQDDGRCGIYEKRPLICSGYSAFPLKKSDYNELEPCERYDLDKPDKEIKFTDATKFAEFAKEHFGFDPAVERQKQKPEYDMSLIKIVETEDEESPTAY